MRSGRSSGNKTRQTGKKFKLTLNIKPKDVISLWLLNILPPSPSLKVKLDLKNMQLQGQKDNCQKFNKKIEKQKEKYVEKVIIDQKQLPQKYITQIKERFQCEVFVKDEIVQTSQYLIENCDFVEIEKFIKKKIIPSTYFYLFFVKRQFENDFNEFIQNISQVSSSSQDDSCLVEEETLKQISQLKVLQSLAQQEQSSSEEEKKKYSSKAKMSETDDMDMNEDDKGFEEEYPLSIINGDQIREWISRNQALDKRDFRIVEKKQSSSIKVSYYYNKHDKDKKMVIVNRFFKFQEVVLLNQGISQQDLKKVENQFCTYPQNYLRCEIFSGYWDPKINENALRKKIIGKEMRNSKKFRKKLHCILIEGIEKITNETSKIIKSFIENLSNKIITKEIVMHFYTLEPYLDDKRVQKLFLDICLETVGKNKNLNFIEVLTVKNTITLKIEIEKKYEEEFEQNQKEKLVSQIKQGIEIQQISDSDSITTKLKKEFNLFPSEENHKKTVLIQKKSQFVVTMKKIMDQIMENNKIMKKEISFRNLFLCFVQDFQTGEFKEYEETVKFTYETKEQSKIAFVGAKRIVEEIQIKVKKYVQELEDNLLVKSLDLQQEEFSAIFENQQKIKNCLQEDKLAFDILKNVNKGCLITAGDQITSDPFDMPIVLFIKRSKKFSQLPPKTIVLLRNLQQVNFSKETLLDPLKKGINKTNCNYKELKDHDRELFFVYSGQYKRIEHFLNYFKKNEDYQLPNYKRRFAFVMPNKQKREFIIDLLQAMEELVTQCLNLQIFVFDNSEQNLQQILNLQKGYKMKKWFVSDGEDDFYYSEEGNQKIRKAQVTEQKKVILLNSDLNLEKITHRYKPKELKLVHWQNKVETKVTFVEENKATVILNKLIHTIDKKMIEQWKQLSDNWEKDIDVSLGFYEIDLEKKIQKNLFTGFKRDLKFKQFESQKFLNTNLQTNYNYEKNQVIIYYEFDQVKRLQHAQDLIKKRINELKIVKKIEINLEELDEKKREFVKIKAIENKIEVKFDIANSQIISIGFDKSVISTFQKLIPVFSKLETQVEYPKNWQEQNQLVQTFQVSEQSEEFKEIQEAFTLHKIKKLLRIQNKPIYKKYFEEKKFLKELNGGKDLKEMKLYHGTSTVNPKNLYEDKETCFNVNFTSEGNFLGRGTYFAEQSEYSNDYSYPYKSWKNKHLLQRFFYYEMLYCSVIVGDSQQIPDVSTESREMKDTGYKDEEKKLRYESSTIYVNGSQIYAVYKNRRAYPLYLIKY